MNEKDAIEEELAHTRAQLAEMERERDEARVAASQGEDRYDEMMKANEIEIHFLRAQVDMTLARLREVERHEAALCSTCRLQAAMRAAIDGGGL
jgi:hypothetical protein